MDKASALAKRLHFITPMNRISLGLLMSRSSKLYRAIRWRAADVLLLILLIAVFFALSNVQPFQRQFNLSDSTISHPFAEHERVTNGNLFLYSTGIPLILIIVIGLIVNVPGYKVYDTYAAALGLLIAVAVTSTTTDILKNFIGRCRPDFLARCIPRAGTPLNTWVLAQDVCTTTNIDRLMDGFRTTPSGHSSLSFAGLLYFSLWLAGQLAVTHELVGAWRSVVASIPCFGAAYIAFSRTQDYRHHFVDVFIGSFIGCAIGAWAYFRGFPSLKHEYAHHSRVSLRLINEKSLQDDVPYDSIDETV